MARMRYFCTGWLFRRKVFSSLILVIFLLSMGASAVQGAPAGQDPIDTDSGDASFIIQRVDSPRLFHSMTSHSLRLDADGLPHIAYGGDRLYYAWNDGSIWRTEVVDSTPGVGSYAALAFDGNGQPHISYYDAINGALMYAVKTGDSWNIQLVDSASGEMLMQPSEQNDYDGVLPPIGDADQRDWRYFYQDPAEYSANQEDPEASLDALEVEEQPVPDEQEAPDDQGATEDQGIPIEMAPLRLTARGIGLFSSIAVDDFDYPSISYYDSINADLKYAHWTGSSWEIFTVDEAGAGDDGDWGMYSSLAMDSESIPHISFYDATHKDLFYATWTGTGWFRDRLDATDDVGQYTSIVLDSNQRAHISYYDNKNGNLKYIRKTSKTAWSTPLVIDSVGNVGQYSSIALANNNPLRPVIAYYDVTKADLRYAYFSNSVWTKETIYSDEFVGRFTSLALVGGSPRISFYDSGRGRLRYATKTGTRSWKIETVDGSADVGPFTSLAFDNAGNPHISYNDDIRDDLKFASWTGSTWQIGTIDSGAAVGLYTSLKIDSANNPHISYYDASNDDIKYARWTGSSWHIQIVDSAVVSLNKTGMNTSLVLDSQNRPRIAYFDGKSNDLKVAIWTGTSWVKRTVDANNDSGRYPSLGIDNEDMLHVSYYGATGKVLRYAKGTADGSAWTKETVDTGETGLYTTITLDNANLPHIAYFNDNGDRLMYVHLTTSGWNIQTVDMSGSVGWYSSIGLDTQGRPHISYYDFGIRSLKYASWNGSVWDIKVVDDRGEVGQYSSLAFTATGSPAISYYDATNGDLKYVTANLATYSSFLYLPMIK